MAEQRSKPVISKIPLWKIPIKVVCIDLDGTITEFAKSLDYIGKLKIGAAGYLRTLKKNNFKIIINTSRPISQQYKIMDYLVEHDVPYDEVVCGKPLAQFYIDDRSIEFKESWAKVHLKIAKLFPEVKFFKE